MVNNQSAAESPAVPEQPIPPSELHKRLADTFNTFVTNTPGEVFLQQKYDTSEDYFLHILTILAPNFANLTPEGVAKILQDRKTLLKNEEFSDIVNRVANSLNIVLDDKNLPPVVISPANLHPISESQIRAFGSDPSVHLAFKLHRSDDMCVSDRLTTDLPGNKEVLSMALAHEGVHMSRDSLSSLFELAKDSIPIEEGIVHLVTKDVLAYMEFDAELIAGETYEVETWMIKKICQVLKVDYAAISHSELKQLLAARFPNMPDAYWQIDRDISSMNAAMETAEAELEEVMGATGSITQDQQTAIMQPVRQLQSEIKLRWQF